MAVEFSTDRPPSPLKPPVWTWEVPLYFFVGGVAGLSAVIALAASLTGEAAATVAAARGVATAGAVVSPMLLIADLGRPARFLYMLRVFKWTSAMSVGAWTLAVFSGATFVALGLWWLAPDGPAWRAALAAADLTAAGAGLVLATYTGVLLGATVIPVWAAHHRMLPFEFGISSLGAAASLVELLGGFTVPLNRVAMAAAAIETALWVYRARKPGSGTQGPRTANHAPRTAHRAPRTAGLLSGPTALILRLAGLAFLPARAGAAAAAIAGSLLLRYGWLAAGRAKV